MRFAAVLFLVVLASQAVAAEPVDFRKQVYPILHDRCFRCHQGADAKSGVRLDLRVEVLNYVKPGRSAESLLITLVTSDNPAQQPQGNGHGQRGHGGERGVRVIAQPPSSAGISPE
jgi:hypothetical protein